MKLLYYAVAGLMLIGGGCAGTGSVETANGGRNVNAPAASSGVRLDLSGTGMEKVDMAVFDKTELEELDLSNNRLTGSLPSQIERLRNLRVLDASDNQMTGVPAEIGRLAQLEVLDLSNNKLTGLPSELGNLRNLRRLDLRGNSPSQQDLDGIRAKLTDTEILY